MSSARTITSPSLYGEQPFRRLESNSHLSEPNSPNYQIRCTNCTSKYFPHFSQTKHEEQQCSLDCRTMHVLRTVPLRRFIQTDQHNRVAPRAMRPPGLKAGNRLLGSNDDIEFSCRVIREQTLNNVSGNLFSLLSC